MKLPLFLSFTIAIIRDQRLRRVWMFYILLAALIMLFLGSTILAPVLARSLTGFAVFWLICGWLTVAAFLLAVFDLLLVRSAAKRAQRQLRRTILGAPDEEDTPED